MNYCSKGVPRFSFFFYPFVQKYEIGSILDMLDPYLVYFIISALEYWLPVFSWGNFSLSEWVGQSIAQLQNYRSYD